MDPANQNLELLDHFLQEISNCPSSLIRPICIPQAHPGNGMKQRHNERQELKRRMRIDKTITTVSETNFW
jgi:hypothetical protein